jgi:hypothetical protein
MPQLKDAQVFGVGDGPTVEGAIGAPHGSTDRLVAWGLPHEAAAHVVAELAANAATRGRLPGRSFRLTLYVIRETLRIEVTDTRCDRLPELRVPPPGRMAALDAESGRGLLLVDALAERWGVAEGRFPRKTVWAELRLPPPGPRPSPGPAASAS